MVKLQSIYFGEVINVHLKDDDPEYQTYIECKLINGESTITARAISKLFKYIPVKGEIVLLIYAPSAYYSKNEQHYEFYYLFPVNLHENQNHNSLFNATTIYADQYDTNQLTQEFGNDFDETDVSDLQAYEGDNILQGRFGNSIRLSKTNVKNNLNHPSTWIKGNSDYNPIIVISNKRNANGVQVTEDINKDGSSIWVSYGQKVNLELASNLFDSYKTKPTTINDYVDNQILINSDRIVLNAKKDDILLHAKKSVQLSSNKTVNIDSKSDTIINSAQTFIGSKDATEPLLFGEKTDAWLKELLGILQQLLLSLSLHTHPTGVGPSGPPMPPEVTKYTGTFKTNIDTIQQKIETLKSKVNFTT